MAAPIGDVNLSIVSTVKERSNFIDGPSVRSGGKALSPIARAAACCVPCCGPVAYCRIAAQPVPG